MTRTPALLAAVAVLAASAPARAADAASEARLWRQAEAMAASIQAPRIPRREVPVTGARPDGVSDTRPAIQRAIDAANVQGGGRVTLGPGVWFSKGPIRLKSRVELHLAAGATLLFSPEAADYLPAVKTRWEGTEVFTYSPLIQMADVEDVAITGPGIIDGNAASGFKAFAEQAEPDFRRLRRMGFDGVPVEQRQFGAGAHLRPPVIQVFGGRRIRLEGYTARNSPFWVNHIVYADQVVVRGLKVESGFANNDGVDVDSSTHVLVEKNIFRTGDDSVVVKSGRDLDGRRIGRPSAWVLVRGNDMGGEDGIAIGSEMSGGVHDIFFEDNILRSGASAIRFKANLDRGGTVERVRVRRFEVEAFKTLIWFQLDYPSELGGAFPATYRDIVFEDFHVAKVDVVLEAHAPAAAPLKGLTLRRMAIDAARTGTVLENVEDLVFEGVMAGGKPLTR